MMYGTCHFVDTEAAVSYYSRYGFDRDEVCGKIKQSEIVIGKPKLEFGERLSVSEGRYMITTQNYSVKGEQND